MKKPKRVIKKNKTLEIINPVKNINTDVWDRGFFLETADGIWYELYVNDFCKKNWPLIDIKGVMLKERMFNNVMLDHYNSDGQITFFVPKKEKNYTFDELTGILE